MKIDLHTHSTFSDGQYTPSELVMMAKESGIEVLALTDHDIPEGNAESENVAKKVGIRFIPGIEISCQDVEEVHMVGLYINYKNKELIDACNRFRYARDRRAIKIIEYLGKFSIPIKLEEVRKIAGEGSIGRPHFARWLIEHGYVSERKEAFSKYLDSQDFHKYVSREKPTPEEAINLIHNAGGKAVLAHPGLLKMSLEKQEQFISKLKIKGLDGIECFYSKHSDSQVKKYVELANTYDLKMSCGSDFHGEKVKPTVKLGMEVSTYLLSGKFIIDM